MAECVEEIFEAGEDTFNESDSSCESVQEEGQACDVGLEDQNVSLSI